LAGAPPTPIHSDVRRVKALVVPHAGYVYSGPIAASAYANIGRIAESVRRVVLVGPCHRVHVRSIAVPSAHSFSTPLGEVEVDQKAIAIARKVADVEVSDTAHAQEHSLEVQLPFLQRVLHDFRIVPIGVGAAASGSVTAVLEALWGGPETLVVISSDLSHYLPYDVARTTDAETADRIVLLDDKPLSHDLACGATGINALLEVARRRRMMPRLLDLRTSGDTVGPHDAVVGYGAFAFEEYV
jgi:AmmeMemoRadiSam system protein B